MENSSRFHNKDKVAKTLKSFSVLLLFMISFFKTSAQLNKVALNVGYEYLTRSNGYIGAEYRLNNNDLKNNQGPLVFGVGSYLYSKNKNLKVIPEVHLNQTWKHFLITELSASTKNIKPSVGISFFNLTRMHFGYSIPINNSELKGFYFGFHILIARSPFYDEIKIY